MSTPSTSSSPSVADLATGTWRVDPARSSVEFHVRHFYGLMTVKGHFDRYEGILDLGSEPAVALTIDANSLDTKNTKRDEHLRSADFFEVEQHPQVRFLSDSAILEGDTLKVHGQLHAAGKHVPLELDATVRAADGELEIEAVTQADHRELGMSWSPLGILRAPSKLIVRGRLLRERAIQQLEVVSRLRDRTSPALGVHRASRGSRCGMVSSTNAQGALQRARHCSQHLSSLIPSVGPCDDREGDRVASRSDLGRRERHPGPCRSGRHVCARALRVARLSRPHPGGPSRRLRRLPGTRGRESASVTQAANELKSPRRNCRTGSVHVRAARRHTDLDPSGGARSTFSRL